MYFVISARERSLGPGNRRIDHGHPGVAGFRHLRVRLAKRRGREDEKADDPGTDRINSAHCSLPFDLSWIDLSWIDLSWIC
jgi:hypothetical protein